jgi:hypothetical protein
MSKSLLLACLVAAITLATCSGKKAHSQTRSIPTVPDYEIKAVEAACEHGGTVLHFLLRETEGEKQPINKKMYCIDKQGRRVLRIECSHQRSRCKSPVVTEDSVEGFRQLLRVMEGNPNTGIDT